MDVLSHEATGGTADRDYMVSILVCRAQFKQLFNLIKDWSLYPTQSIHLDKIKLLFFLEKG